MVAITVPTASSGCIIEPVCCQVTSAAATPTAGTSLSPYR